MSKILKQSVWEKAKLITSTFEGGYPTGNFDGQYLSMGTFQHNLGQKTLQPILHRVFDTYGADKWGLQELHQAVLNDNIDFYKQLSGYGTCLVEPWKTRLNELNNSEEFKKIYDEYCGYYRDKAISVCESFGITTDRAFCLALDICVQNGSLSYYEMTETEYIDRLKSWAETAIFKTNKQWKNDVRARKMAILYGCDQGRGWADVEFDDLSMYEDENIEKKEDEDIMTREQIRAELLIPDASWGVEQVNTALQNKLLSQKHDANEIVTMGVLCAMMNSIFEQINNTLEEIKKTIQENK
jgi:hypothetical protein